MADRRALSAKLADILASQHGKVEEAVVVYRKLVEEDPGDLATVETLDQMLRAAGRHDDLRWLFELRASTASPSERAPLFVEWATLEEEVFGDPQRAVFLYRRVLETEPSHEPSLAALTRLLLAANDPKGAAEMLSKRRDLSSGSDRKDRDLDLAEIYAGPLEQPVEALDAVIQALELAPRDSRAIAMLERLMEVPATRGRAAEALQEEIRARW